MSTDEGCIMPGALHSPGRTSEFTDRNGFCEIARRDDARLRTAAHDEAAGMGEIPLTAKLDNCQECGAEP